MQVFRTLYDLDPALKGGCLAIGNFDGIHKGHQHIFQTLTQRAQAEDIPAGVLTFTPHSRAFFNPDQPPFRLTVLEDKVELLRTQNLDFCVALDFDVAFSKLSADDFIGQILVEGLGAKHVFVGQQFGFGHQRQGTIETLQNAAQTYGFDVHPIAEMLDKHGHPFSSSNIRQAIRDGDMPQAQALLGRLFHITGIVECGARQGHRIGFATANINMHDYVRPLYGVYAVLVEIEGEDALRKGVANIGVRPTVGGHKEWLEVHILDFKGTLYGKRLKVQLVDFIRAEMKFKNMSDLKTQIPIDIEHAKKRLEAF
jgi:riboflavin kinase/FMN adenylyltransferase